MMTYDWERLLALGYSEDTVNALNDMSIGNAFEREPGRTPHETKMSEMLMPRDTVLKRLNDQNKTLPMKASANEQGYVEKTTGDLKDACWDGYTAVGMKKKGGRMVPNCVPIKKRKG
jgi:hypothetical protein